MIGRKVTVLFREMTSHDRPDPSRPPRPFLRCRVIRILPDGLQLYDPVADWSWGAPLGFKGRVLHA